MNKSILVVLCGGLILCVGSGCENDLRDNPSGTTRSNLESAGETDTEGREASDEPAADVPSETGEEPAADVPSETGEEPAVDLPSDNGDEPRLEETDSGTDTASDPEVAPTGIYRGYFCEEGLFIETREIPAADALANCGLNASSNPDREVYCTWNDEVIYDGCSDATEEVPTLEACEGWEAASLERAGEFIDTTYWSAEEMDCDGPSFRRFDARYGLWLGLVSCEPGYRFFLSETADGPYLPAADYGGHGQDLCELVDPSFSLPNEDDITSGGCSACAIGFNYSFIAGEVFARGAFGQPFTRGEAPSWGPYQSSVIQCASGPVECGIAED